MKRTLAGIATIALALLVPVGGAMADADVDVAPTTEATTGALVDEQQTAQSDGKHHNGKGKDECKKGPGKPDCGTPTTPAPDPSTPAPEPSTPAPKPTNGDDDDLIKICHATQNNSNPYIVLYVEMNSTAGGHDSHNGPVWPLTDKETGKWGDIIPSYTYTVDGVDHHYVGKNWGKELEWGNLPGVGKGIWENDCKPIGGGGTDPTDEPTDEPTTDKPTDKPTDPGTEKPTDEPSEPGTEEPTDEPTDKPSVVPTTDPGDPGKPTPTKPTGPTLPSTGFVAGLAGIALLTTGAGAVALSVRGRRNQG